MAEAELLLEVVVEVEGGVEGGAEGGADGEVEAGDGRVRLSVTSADAGVRGRGYGPREAAAGAGEVLVAVRSGGPVTVRVYDGCPDLHGWALVETARLVVGTDGVDVGTVAGAVDHWVPVQEGPVTVEAWVRGPGEVTFVLSR